MTQFDIQYMKMAENIMSYGQEHLTRATDPITGKQLKAKKLFHQSFEFDLREEFPILTTKKMPKSKTHPENGFLFQTERHWIWVMGSHKVQDLRDLGNTVWDEWEIKEGPWRGTVGKTYGYQARQLKKPIIKRIPAPIYSLPNQPTWHPWEVEYEHIDQVQNLIDGIKNDPFGRRHMVDFWSVPDLEDMGLPPCAFLTIWDVTTDGYLNCHLIQRSGDFGLGIPFNVSQYAELTHMIAHVTGLKAGTLAHDITNMHIYENHYPMIEKQLERKPKDCKPKIWVNPEITDFNDFKPTDTKILNYDSHPGIKAPIGV